MRAMVLSLALLGCGPVRLGDEANVDPDELDAAPSPQLDADAALSVTLTVSAPVDCKGCVQILAEGAGGLPPYAFSWEDGSREARRHVCPGDSASSPTVVAQDQTGARSPPRITHLELLDASCPVEASVPPPTLLCLQNPSFEGMPAINSGVPEAFDASPWSACTNPAASNTPDIGNDTIQQVVAISPKPTDGATFLGLAEGEQASQRLCRAITGGTELSFELDLSHILVGSAVVPDTEAAFLEIWGGVAADCSQRELLWASPALAMPWKRFCVTLTPQQFTDNLTLRSRSDGSLPTPTYVAVDHLVPVERCP